MRKQNKALLVAFVLLFLFTSVLLWQMPARVATKANPVKPATS